MGGREGGRESECWSLSECLHVCITLSTLTHTSLLTPSLTHTLSHSHTLSSLTHSLTLTCMYIHVYTAEWQVMCVFKALHVNPNDTHSELREKEFYDFYEVQNLKWRKVHCKLGLLFIHSHGSTSGSGGG